MTADLSLIHLIANASVLVQVVMALLFLASILSWAVIYGKSRQLNLAKKEADRFEEVFWSGGDVGDIYKNLHPRRDELKGMERIFEAGLSEYARLHRQTRDPESVISGAQRAMRTTLARETDEIEANLSFLATVGSTSPYVGLFGTVWGIMNSFRALGNVQQATLSMVAPGIAEALIATAMGLFAAIPAVIAYNRFANQVNRLLSSYDNFIEEFSTLLQRQIYASKEKKSQVS
ncbi:MAG TPA: protein TolQ [Gammaproteobacteria bacterium]|nr:protein TolQ [Gammaproteobacteria bacterium]